MFRTRFLTHLDTCHPLDADKHTRISYACDSGPSWHTKGLVLAILILVSLSTVQFRSKTHMAFAAVPNAAAITSYDLYELTLNHDGGGAVQQLAVMANMRGKWGPAPGDSVVYDPELALSVRAAVQIADLPPAECADGMMNRHTGRACDFDLTEQQDTVRFGYSTFVDVADDGSMAPRLTPDDLLAVYIEEVGHSWQEYLYETEGRGRGERTRLTSWAMSEYWAAGWEYQVKRYVLSLDGTWLTLSGAAQDELKSAICADYGYANPMHNAVSDNGPPPDWPNPLGWPTAAPTVEEFQAFCHNRSLLHKRVSQLSDGDWQNLSD